MGSSTTADSTVKRTKQDEALNRIADLISSGKVAKKIVVLTGAGISTSAGIPDFRSPSTGLYHNLQKLNLPHPQAVFELGYFKRNPKPFWILAKELYPGKHFPTPTHYFFTLLAQHGLLRRVFSQNIDTLDTQAGLAPALIIEAHGSFATAHCLSCRREVSTDYVLQSGVRTGQVVHCGEKGCKGLVKPDIVFFGEGLPDRFFSSMSDLKTCDLLIIIGTSLQVQPFASLPDHVPSSTPRVLINREPVGPFESLSPERPTRGRDTYWEGDADDGIKFLVDSLGWREEFETLKQDGRERLEKEWDSQKGKEDVAVPVSGADGGREETPKRERDTAAQKSRLVGDGTDTSPPAQDDEAASDDHDHDHDDDDDDDDDDVGSLQRAIEKDLNLR